MALVVHFEVVVKISCCVEMLQPERAEFFLPPYDKGDGPDLQKKDPKDVFPSKKCIFVL